MSRRPEKLSAAAAAVSVISAEDLRRSGVTSLAEAMRLGAAVDVVRVNASTWAVTSRGFQISTANKLLVLVDGRTVYSPLFSGTFWEVQELVFDDVDRIESIRGPGGAVWGANAMNGVVNVITKPTSRTRGSFAMVTTGSDEHALTSGRYGARMGESGDYRVYGKFRQRNAGVNTATGSDEGNGLLMGHGGFRIDSDESRSSRWSLQGEIYRGAVGLVARPDGDLAGGNLVGRYARRFSSTSELSAEAYDDRTWRKIPLQFEETSDTVGVHAQHDCWSRIGTTSSSAQTRASVGGNDQGVAGFFFDPEQRTNQVYGGFIQDEIAVKPSRLFLILGTKLGRQRLHRMRSCSLRSACGGCKRTPRCSGAPCRAPFGCPPASTPTCVFVNPATGAITLTGDARTSMPKRSSPTRPATDRPRTAGADVAVFVNRYDSLRSQELPVTSGQPVTLRTI